MERLPKISSSGKSLHFAAGGRRGGGGNIPAQGPGALWSWTWWSSLAATGAMEEMPGEAEGEEGNAPVSAPVLGQCLLLPPAQREASGMEPARGSRAG